MANKEPPNDPSNVPSHSEPLNTCLDPVKDPRNYFKIVIDSVRQIWEERDTIWYIESLQLLRYIRQQVPYINEDMELRYKKLICNLKMKVLVYMYLSDGASECYWQCVQEWFENDDPLYKNHAVYALTQLPSLGMDIEWYNSPVFLQEYYEVVNELNIFLDKSWVIYRIML